MAAPLVVHTEEDLRADAQDMTVLLHDFTFRDPAAGPGRTHRPPDRRMAACPAGIAAGTMSEPAITMHGADTST